MRIKENNCHECPFYGAYYDSFIGDGDEWCECGICEWGSPLGCKYPLFIRHFLAWKERKKQEKWDKQAQKEWEKELEEMYRLGMDEEHYYEYKEKTQTDSGGNAGE